MAKTYEPISTVSVGSTTSTINFNSIPQTYTDLRLVILCVTGASVTLKFTVNGDTAANYSVTTLLGRDTGFSGSTAYTGQSYFSFLTNGGTSTTQPTFHIGDIFSYTNSKYKMALLSSFTDENKDTTGAGFVQTNSSLWRSTAAITSISLSMTGSGSFLTGSRATLYGIKAA